MYSMSEPIRDPVLGQCRVKSTLEDDGSARVTISTGITTEDTAKIESLVIPSGLLYTVFKGVESLYRMENARNGIPSDAEEE
jgi:hypothetical protein